MMTKVSVLMGILVFTLAVGAGDAWATPSTQIWIPSTDTQPAGTVHVGVDNYNTVFKKGSDGGHGAPTVYGLTFGAVDSPFVGVEFGADLKEYSDDPIYLNVKVQIKEDSVHEFFPAIAIGGYDFGSKSDETDFNIIYGLVSKNFPVVGRFSLGYYIGNDALLQDDNSGALFSWDRTLAEIDDRLWVAVDYMGGSNSYGALSFGLAWRFSPHISALAGYDAYTDNAQAGEDTFTVQFDIDF